MKKHPLYDLYLLAFASATTGQDLGDFLLASEDLEIPGATAMLAIGVAHARVGTRSETGAYAAVVADSNPAKIDGLIAGWPMSLAILQKAVDQLGYGIDLLGDVQKPVQHTADSNPADVDAPGVPTHPVESDTAFAPIGGGQ